MKLFESPLYEFKPWQGDEAYKKAWEFLDLCLVTNAKEYHRVVKDGKEPTYSQDKAVKLFAKRSNMEKNLAERKAAKKKQDGISKAAKEQAEVMMGLRVESGGDDDDTTSDVLGELPSSNYLNTIARGFSSRAEVEQAAATAAAGGGKKKKYGPGEHDIPKKPRHVDHVDEASSIIASLKENDSSFDRLISMLSPPVVSSVESAEVLSSRNAMETVSRLTALIKDAMAEQKDLQDSGDDAAIADNKAMLASLRAKRARAMNNLVV